MAAIRDLDTLLRTLSVSRRPGRWTVVALPEPVPLSPAVAAVLTEAEAVTAVVTVEEALRRGWDHEFVAAWLTLDVRSALEAVGLTAAVAAALTEAGIPCNVLAGFHHDHLLVPEARADEAMAAIAGVAEAAGGTRPERNGPSRRQPRP